MNCHIRLGRPRSLQHNFSGPGTNSFALRPAPRSRVRVAHRPNRSTWIGSPASREFWVPGQARCSNFRKGQAQSLSGETFDRAFIFRFSGQNAPFSPQGWASSLRETEGARSFARVHPPGGFGAPAPQRDLEAWKQGPGVYRPLNRRIVARLTSRSASRVLRSSRLSNSAFPFPTPNATFTFPFFQ